MVRVDFRHQTAYTGGIDEKNRALLILEKLGDCGVYPVQRITTSLRKTFESFGEVFMKKDKKCSREMVNALPTSSYPILFLACTLLARKTLGLYY